MDWTKIKSKHFLPQNLSFSEKGVLATLLVYTAMIERMPTFKEMCAVCRTKNVQKLNNSLTILGEKLEHILEKVLEDCEKVEDKRFASRETSARYREKQRELKPIGDTSHDTTEKRREEKRREEKSIIEKKETSRFVKPTYEELNAFIKENKYSIDPNTFLDYYQSKGWKIGKSPMKDWKATVRNWDRRENPKKQEGMCLNDV